MKNDTLPDAVPRMKGRPAGARKRGPIGLPGTKGPLGKPRARDARGETGSVGVLLPAPPITGAGAVAPLAVVQMQIDNIHRELETQMHRTAQLETLVTRVQDKLHELVGLSKWLIDNSGKRRTSGVGLPRNVSH